MEGRVPIRERGDEKSFEVLGDMGHAASRSEVFDGLDGPGGFGVPRGALCWCWWVAGQRVNWLKRPLGVGDSVIR